jgi:hypothetical protein
MSMGNRVGVILHEDWNNFSPLLYSHNGANLIPFKLQEYLKQYIKDHNLDNHDGHLYNEEHMMLGFIQSLDKDVHMRIESLSESSIQKLQDEHDYPNCFDCGCWIVNVSTGNFGETVSGDGYYLDNDNIVKDELNSEYSADYHW